MIELALHREPCNEIGSLTLDELEQFAADAGNVCNDNAHALIIYSTHEAGFCAGADLRELYHRSQEMERGKSGCRGARLSGAHSPGA